MSGNLHDACVNVKILLAAFKLSFVLLFERDYKLFHLLGKGYICGLLLLWRDFSSLSVETELTRNLSSEVRTYYYYYCFFGSPVATVLLVSCIAFTGSGSEMNVVKDSRNINYPQICSKQKKF